MEEMLDLINFNLSDFIFQVINISILLFFLNKFLFKKVMAVIDDRNKEVNNVYNDIDEAWGEIKTKENKYTALLTNVKAETDDIIAKAKQESKLIKEKSLMEARESADKEIKRARLSIESEKRVALEEIKSNISELVVKSTEAVLKDNYKGSAKQPVAEQFINGLGEKNE